MKKIVVVVAIIISVFFNLCGCSPSENDKSNQKNMPAQVTPQPVQVAPPPVQAEDYFKSGTEHSARGEYLLAIESFGKAINQNPKATEAYIRRAFAYYKLGNREQALADIKIAAEYGYQGAQKVIEESVRVSVLKEVAKDDHFIAYNNGTVLDRRTNLMWAATDNGDEGINWYDAKRYCENYRGGGYADWRMPTINELTSLYDRRRQHSIGVVTYACLTKLIKLTNNYIWATDTSGSRAANFNFFNANINWHEQNIALFSRVVPVREAERKDYLEVFFSGIAPLPVPTSSYPASYSAESPSPEPAPGVSPSPAPPPPVEQHSEKQAAQNQNNSAVSESSQTQRGTGEGFVLKFFLIIGVIFILIILSKKILPISNKLTAKTESKESSDVNNDHEQKKTDQTTETENLGDLSSLNIAAERDVQSDKTGENEKGRSEFSQYCGGSDDQPDKTAKKDKSSSKKESAPDPGKKKKFDPSKVIVKK